MAGFGIGLGAFVDGFSKGYGIRSEIDDRKTARTRQATEDKWRAKERARQEELWGRQDKEYQRQDTYRSNIEQINKDAQSKFDAAVSSGQEQPDNFDAFWNNYAVPKMRNEALVNGDMGTAEKLSQWAETAGAKQGAKLFMGGLTKAQTGDYEGALDDFLKAGQTKGYLNHDMQFVSKDRLVDPSGKLLGYRLKMKGADGREIAQDVTLQQIPQLGAQFFNPEAAWQTQMQAEQAAAKREQDLKTYREKKSIDKEMGMSSGKERSGAIKTLRDRLNGEIDVATGEPRPNFDELPSDQKEKLIADEIALQTGQIAAQPGLGQPAAAGPQRKVIVDTATNRAMTTDDVQSQRRADTAAAAADKVRSSEPAAAKRQEAETERFQQEDDSERAKAFPRLIKRAKDALAKGKSVGEVQQFLQQMGVPQEMWPKEIPQPTSG